MHDGKKEKASLSRALSTRGSVFEQENGASISCTGRACPKESLERESVTAARDNQFNKFRKKKQDELVER